MRFLHIADLHLGKVIHGVSMLENGDQPAWVDRFLALTREVRPRAVVMAGDVYDRSTPSGEAVELLNRLVVGLAEQGITVLITAGNHDSGSRLSFARDLLAREGVHIAGAVKAELDRVTLEDEYGPVHFWLMPYVFPAAAAQALGQEIRDYETAVRRLLEAQPLDAGTRNVIAAHQNVTAFGREQVRGGSESAVGGVGGVDYTSFDAFDYAALGHIHAAYPVGREEVRYAGSPLCYHFGETRQPRKGPLLVDLGPKGAPPVIRTLEIPPLHPMRELRGTFEELREAELADRRQGEYLRLVLTDRPMTPEISDFFQNLAEERGSVLMERVSEYRRFGEAADLSEATMTRERSVEELFADYFAERTGSDPDDRDLALLEKAGELLRRTPPDPRQRGAADPALTEQLLSFLMMQEGEKA